MMSTVQSDSLDLSKLKLSSSDTQMSWSSDSVFELEEYFVEKQYYEFLNVSGEVIAKFNAKIEEFVNKLVTTALQNQDAIKALKKVDNLPTQATEILKTYEVRIKLVFFYCYECNRLFFI